MHRGRFGNAADDAEYAKEEAEPMAKPEPKSEMVVKDVQAVGTPKDMERTLKLIRQGKETEGKIKKGRGKDKVKGKDKDKGTTAGKENKLVKATFKINTKAKDTIVHKVGERSERQFRYPVLNGRWWIIRL